MDCMERVRRAIRYESPDRVPAGLFGTTLAYQAGLAEAVGCRTIEGMYETLGIDIWHTATLAYRGGTIRYRGFDVDPVAALYDEHNPHPPFRGEPTLDEVAEFSFPSMEAFDTSALEADIRAHDGFALCLYTNAAIFHNFLYLCGQEDAMCLLVTNPDVAMAIIGKIADYWTAYLARTLEVAGGRGVFAENCNDFGTQRSLFISVEDYRTFFKPHLKRFADTAHRYGVFYMQHSCGAIRPLIDDYIESGADILNPIQITASGMDLEGIVRDYRGRIAFYGGIDTQYLLPGGTEEEIRSAVRSALSFFGGQGGFILSGSQGLMEDIPYSHAIAMLDPELRA